MKRLLLWRHRAGSPFWTAGSLITRREYVIERGNRDKRAPLRVTYTAWTREHPRAPMTEIDWEHGFRAAKRLCADMEAER